MAEKTGIAWCTSTFNPWIGCTRIGPGCDHCYAEQQDARKRWGGVTHWGAGVPRYRTSASNWARPLAWNRKQQDLLRQGDAPPWRVFCASLADVFDNEVPQEWREDLWKLIAATPYLSWLLVTKRVGNVGLMVPPVRWNPFPENVRLLITVCDQKEADRDIPKLLALPCKNGISYEPALEQVDFYRYLVPWNHSESRYGKRLEWLIVGGESGPKARPFDIEWSRDTILQCRSAGVPVFMKQIGSNTVDWCLGNGHSDPENHVRCQSYEASEQGKPCPIGVCMCRINRAGADPSEWPEDLRVREFP